MLFTVFCAAVLLYLYYKAEIVLKHVYYKKITQSQNLYPQTYLSEKFPHLIVLCMFKKNKKTLKQTCGFSGHFLIKVA